MKRINAFVLFLGVSLAQSAQAEIELGQITFPVGFSIDVYAENVENARRWRSVSRVPRLSAGAIYRISYQP